MHLRSVEALFARYRKRADAGALAEVFDRTAPELFRLAQHLVRDPLAAEDVLQETFVAAIDAAARWDDARALVPWLTGILARKASESRRSARRSPEPERLFERSAEDPAKVAVEAEFSRELRAALAGLPQLYREVLERHLYDGARPAEIARDLERAPGTVRMQIHRGLEQLRRVLPAGFAAGAVLAAFSPRGLAGVREAVLAHAAGVAALTSAGAVGAASWGLGQLLSLAAVALLALLGLPLGLYLARATPESPVVPAAPVADAQASVERTPVTPMGLASSARALPEVSLERRSGPRLVLRGRVSGPEPDELADVQLEVHGVGRYEWPTERVARGRPAPDGTFEIVLDDLLDVARQYGQLDDFRLRADHPHWLPASLVLMPTDARLAADEGGGAELWAEVALRRAILLRGEARAVQGSSLPIRVAALPIRDGAPVRQGLALATADAEGRFTLRLAAEGEVEVVASSDAALPDSLRLWVGSGGAALARPLRLEPGVGLEGTWRNGAQRVPFERFRLIVADQQVELPYVTLGARHLAWLRGAWRVERLDVPLDESGAFSVRGLEPGSYTARPDLWPIQRVTSFDQTLDLILPLESREFDLAAGLLAIEVKSREGRAQAAPVWVALDERAIQLPFDGRNELVLAAPSGAAVALRAGERDDSDAALRLTVPEPGARLEVELQLADPEAEARARLWIERDPDVEPGAEFTLTARELGGPAGSWSRRIEFRGEHLDIGQLPVGDLELEIFRVAAYRHFQEFLLPSRCRVFAAPGHSSEVRFDLERGGRLRLVARDADGLALPAACRVSDLYGLEQEVRFLVRGPDQMAFTESGTLSERGPVDVYPNLPAGVYELEFSHAGGAARRITARVTAGEVSEVEVRLP